MTYFKLGFAALFALTLDMIIIAEVFLYKLLLGTSELVWWQNCLHLCLISILWGVVAIRIVRHIKMRGTDLLASRHRNLSASHAAALILLILAGVLYMCSTWGFQIKPAAEFQNMLARHGRFALPVFLCQHLYYLMESILITLIVITGRLGFESRFASKKLPYGGLFCAATWGMIHALSKDWETALLCILLSLLFDYSYLASNRNFFLTCLAVATMFIL